jgi:hypothetical protein
MAKGDFSIIAVTYLGPMLPPGGRNWQLISPHFVQLFPNNHDFLGFNELFKSLQSFYEFKICPIMKFVGFKKNCDDQVLMLKGFVNFE